jgi:tetratricopeptide (TPR) repeat protein
MRRVSRRIFLPLLLAVTLAQARAQGTTETMPEHNLKLIVERQRSLLDQAAQAGEKLDSETLRVQLQAILHDYEILLHDNPKFAEAYVAQGYLLNRVGMRREAVELMLKANQLNPDIPIVKNQIGNYLAEDGKPLEAVGYYLAAIKLDPKEPLYHYQLGMLLHEGRDDFIKSGDWTRDSIGNAEHEAFRHASELAPDKLEYAYGYGISFYDLPKPDWDEALKFWGQLENKAQNPKEQQAIRLEAANLLIYEGKPDAATILLNTVTETTLQDQKQKLVAQIAEKAKK